MSSSPLELRELFRRGVDEYPVEDIGEGVSDTPVRQIIEEKLPERLRESVGEEIVVQASTGKGRLTSIPWIALLDSRETDDIQRGVYLVYLFEPQEDRLYLTFNQGVTELLNDRGRSDARSHLLEQARSIRETVDIPGFESGPLSFEHASPRNELYGPGTIYYRRYDLENLPDDETFRRDLERGLKAYSEHVTGSSDSWQPATEREYRAQWLADRYQEARSWEELEATADRTTRAVETLLRAIVDEYSQIDTAALTALFRVCQHDGQINVDTKREAVEDLSIPEEDERAIHELVDEGTGSVGGPNFALNVPDRETRERLHDIFERLLDRREADHDDAVRELASLDIDGVQAGSLSPILHYLHPTEYPIVNGLVADGVGKYFGLDFGTDIGEYLENAEAYRQVRDRYGFRSHFRDVDYFFVWAEAKSDRWDHDWTWAIGDDGEVSRSAYVIQPGNPGESGRPDERPALWRAWRDHGFVSVGGEDGDLRALSEEERRAHGDSHGWGATAAWETLMEMSPGDVVVAKWGTSKFVGIGVVEPDSYRYEADGPGYASVANETSTAHPHLRDVEWVVTDDDGWRCDEIGLTNSLVRDTTRRYDYFEELRYKLGDYHEESVAKFAALEAASREYHGGSETDFEREGREQGTPILDGSKETVRPDVDGDALFDGLYYPLEEELRQRIAAAVQARKHVVFTGPPGTGKTELAENLADHLAGQSELEFTGYALTTATADWSTFDTVGGRIPSGDGDQLVFSPGLFLERFKRDGGQRNDILIVDELNRADIDKAFGQLFTVLSGQSVQLQFEVGGEPIEIVPESNFEGNDPADHEFVVPTNWRLFATMNSYDKASLYEMSYAFMRRLAFVEVDIPDLDSEAAQEDPVEFLAPYLAEWYETDAATIDASVLEADQALPRPDDVGAVVDVWRTLTVGENTRPVGPALVEDILAYVEHHEGPLGRRLADAIEAYVYPQLEGIPDAKEIVDELAGLDAVGSESDRLRSTAETSLDVSFGAGRDDDLVNPD